MLRLTIGQRYTMPDGTTGKYLGIRRGIHVDLHCFRLAGAVASFAKLTATQALTLLEAAS